MSKTYPLDLKKQVIQEVIETKSISTVAKMHNIPTNTVWGWVKKNKSGDTINKNESQQKLLKELEKKDIEIQILKELLKKTNQIWLKD